MDFCRLKLWFSSCAECRFGARARGIRFWMNKHSPIFHADVKCRDFLHEGRWGRASVGLILITVPGASDTAENNFTLAKWAVLMLADVRDGGNFSIVFENGRALAREQDNASTILENVGHGA